jgi:hypothetical protein
MTECEEFCVMGVNGTCTVFRAGLGADIPRGKVCSVTHHPTDRDLVSLDLHPLKQTKAWTAFATVFMHPDDFDEAIGWLTENAEPLRLH